jgi:hypothetical protein
LAGRNACLPNTSGIAEKIIMSFVFIEVPLYGASFSIFKKCGCGF